MPNSVFKLSNIKPKDIVDIYINFRKDISKRYLLVEFNSNFVLFAEVRHSGRVINFDKINKITLPKEAIEKGIPTEPEQMSELIKSYLIEQKIYVKRSAIVITQDAAYSRLINIPSDVSEINALDYVLNKSNTLQIPIPIAKTDFDISRTSLPEINIDNKNFTSYYLSSIPKKSMNILIDTCKFSQLDLHKVDLANTSLAKIIEPNIKNLSSNQFIILLELLDECTHFTLIDTSGPINTDRLTAIRNFPLNGNSIKSINEKEFHDDYLPISKLDIQILAKEVLQKAAIFLNSFKDNVECNVYLAGLNSAHPNITKVLGKVLKLPTYLISPLFANGIGKVKYDESKITDMDVARLIGLGLGLVNYNNDYSSPSNNKQSFIKDCYIPENVRNIKKIYIYKSKVNRGNIPTTIPYKSNNDLVKDESSLLNNQVSSEELNLNQSGNEVKQIRIDETESDNQEIKSSESLNEFKSKIESSKSTNKNIYNVNEKDPIGKSNNDLVKDESSLLNNQVSSEELNLYQSGNEVKQIKIDETDSDNQEIKSSKFLNEFKSKIDTTIKEDEKSINEDEGEFKLNKDSFN